MLDLAIHVIVWMKLCNKNCVLNRRPIDREGLKFNFFSVSHWDTRVQSFSNPPENPVSQFWILVTMIFSIPPICHAV